MDAAYRKTNAIIACCLLLIALFVSLDIFEDYSEGATITHLLIEISVLFLSSGVFVYILSGWFNEQKQSKQLRDSVDQLGQQKTELQKELQTHMNGLSKVIENQFQMWKLTESEKEVGFLLLKGFSLKEIADVRGCSEKTVHAQSQSIYKKSTCRGRSEFSAYFLEDLLPPSQL